MEEKGVRDLYPWMVDAEVVMEGKYKVQFIAREACPLNWYTHIHHCVVAFCCCCCCPGISIVID